MRTYHYFFILLLGILFLTTAWAEPDIIYEEARIPMALAGDEGLEALFVWPNDTLKHPAALISHGSPRDAALRSQMSAISYLPIAMEFARRGFSVAVVLRRNYGTSGGEWAEGFDTCAATNYLQSAKAASEDLHAAVNYLDTLPQFDTSRFIAVGISAGGFSTIALTAFDPPPGLKAAISFAGGRGSQASDTLCKPDQLVKAFGILGKTSRIPMLWVYAVNDHFFNPVMAKQFYKAFSNAGGNATLMMVKPYGNEGHFLFSNAGIPVWTPILDYFLETQNLKLVDELLPLPTVNLKAPKILSSQGKKDFADYLKDVPHKAFALSPDGAYGWRVGQKSIKDAKESSLTTCQHYTKKKCKVINIDNEVVE